MSENKSNSITTLEDFLEYLNKVKNKHITKSIVLKDIIFKDSIVFEEYTFKENISFNRCTFEKYVSFKETTFEDEVKFTNSVFKDDVDFSEVEFKADTYFNGVKAYKNIIFENAECVSNSIDFSYMKVYRINLFKVNFQFAHFIQMQFFDTLAQEQLEPSKLNFINKDSARVIKATLDTQKNFKESHKYFAVEQELYLDELEKKKLSFKSFPLKLDKFVSNFGTQWKRVLYILAIFTFVSNMFVTCIYGGSIFDVNRMIELVVPLKIFAIKSENDLGVSIWLLTLIRIISAYLFWQIVRAFRLDTKRF